MSFVKARREFLQRIGGLMSEYFESWVSLEGEYESRYLELLKDVFNDDGGWISYWVYELDFGRNATEDCVQDEDGKNIPIKTINDLYNLLTNEKSN